MQVDGTTGIVTGAASGLGAATAAALARAGAAVIGLDIAIPGSARDVPDRVRLFTADVTDEDAVRAAIATVEPQHLSLRFAVTCAGIAPAQRPLSGKGVHELALSRRPLEVNLIGTFYVLRLAAEAIAQTEPDADGQRGVIVNTASIAAFDGQIGQVAYAA